MFIIIITIGFSLYGYITTNKEYKDLLDKNNSPIQVISQLKGYFYINPLLSLSLAITIFSFVGIPPLVGFFAKQMVLSAALDNGYIFLTLIAILTSVIGAVYYLNIIKKIFFYLPDHSINPSIGEFLSKKGLSFEAGDFKGRITLISSPFSITISIITLVILLFIFLNKEWLSMGTINLLFLLCAKEFFACDLSLLLNKNRFKEQAPDTYLTSSLKGYFSTYNRLSSIRGSIASRYMATTPLSSIFFQQTLGYSTISQNQIQPTSPWFISGYSDAEGCFNVRLQKNPNGKFYVRPSFQIHVHSKDNLLLMQIKAYFQGIGNIYVSGDKSKFTVRSLDEILKIITHFDNYPLITQKKADFILFKQIIDKVVNGEHLSAKGLQDIVNIRSSINTGLSNSLKAIFPNTIPVTRPLIKTIAIPHPEWMAGFVSGEGCFLVQIAKYGKGKLDGVSLSFKVSQHLRDELLLRSFISFFECGLFNYHSGNSKIGSGVFIVRKFADISDKILPFFKYHKIRGIKREDFEDWVRVVELIKSKAHLTEDEVKKIRVIKSGMNTLR